MKILFLFFTKNKIFLFFLQINNIHVSSSSSSRIIIINDRKGRVRGEEEWNLHFGFFPSLFS